MRWWFIDDFRDPDELEPRKPAAVADRTPRPAERPVIRVEQASAARSPQMPLPPAAPPVVPSPPPPAPRESAPRRPWRDRIRVKPTRRNRLLLAVGKYVGGVLLGYYVLAVLLLVAYRFVPPPITGVQLERRIEAAFTPGDYRVQKTRVGYSRLPAHVPRAVVAAEDGRFFSHWGFDLAELRDAGMDALEGEGMRGASTITQQLMKNLFGCTCRNPVRKLYDYGLTIPAEIILPKERILELYLNNVEWGPGIFGIQAAARHHYGVDARNLSRAQAAGLAALLPNPLRRTTRSTAAYRAEILRRMNHRGW